MTAIVLAYLDLMPATRRGLPVAAMAVANSAAARYVAAWRTVVPAEGKQALADCYMFLQISI